jgi:hypothetical protein
LAWKIIILEDGGKFGEENSDSKTATKFFFLVSIAKFLEMYYIKKSRGKNVF